LFLSCQLLLVQNQVQGKDQHQETMTSVTKHYSEQEGESDESEKTRVDLTVSSNTIRVNDTLETFRELVGAMERRRFLASS
jgi:hypothetical protein